MTNIEQTLPPEKVNELLAKTNKHLAVFDFSKFDSALEPQEVQVKNLHPIEFMEPQEEEEKKQTESIVERM